MDGDKETLPLNRSTAQSTQPRSAIRRNTQPDIGASAFLRYERALRQDAARTAPVPSRLEIGLSLLGNSIVIASVFAPWIKYDTWDNHIEKLIGVSTDAVLLIPVSVVAIVALTCVFLRKVVPMMSMVGFVTSLVGFVVAGATWMVSDSVAIDDPRLTGLPSADWGAIVGSIAALIATILAFRVMRVARMFE